MYRVNVTYNLKAIGQIEQLFLFILVNLFLGEFVDDVLDVADVVHLRGAGVYTQQLDQMLLDVGVEAGEQDDDVVDNLERKQAALVEACHEQLPADILLVEIISSGFESLVTFS